MPASIVLAVDQLLSLSYEGLIYGVQFHVLIEGDIEYLWLMLRCVNRESSNRAFDFDCLVRARFQTAFDSIGGL